MDRRERYNDPEEALRLALEGKQAQIWTALPGIIQSFDHERHTCTVQPATRAIVRNIDGTTQEVALPLLLDCPVFFPSGGGVTLTFPIKAGDECLVVFASRCIDSWWQQGGVQGQAELRMHDLSDGFVFAGVRSQPRKFGVSTSAAQLRCDDGLAFVEINPTTHAIKAETTASITAQAGGNITATAGGDIDATASGEITLTAPTIRLDGDVHITGDLDIDGTTVGGGINLQTHTHTGVVPGGGTSGPPL